MAPTKRRARASKKKGTRKGRKRSSAKSITAIVRHEMGKELETKMVTNLPYWTGNITTTGALSGGLFTYITLGTSANQRIGDEIHCRGIRWSGIMKGGQSGSGGITDDAWNRVTIVIFEGAAGLTLSSLGTSAPQNDTIWNKEYVQNIGKVMYKRTFLLKPGGVDGSGYQIAVQQFHIYVKLNMKITYYSTNKPDKDYYVYAVSDSGASPYPSIPSDNMTIYYKDS